MMSFNSPVMFKSIHDWLENLELKQYDHFFSKFHGLEELVKLSESDLKKLGVKSASDRARMMSSLSVMKGKRSRSFRKKNVEKNHQLQKIKEQSAIPQTMHKLLFHTNKTLTGPLGIAFPLNLPLVRDVESNSWFHGLITRSQAENRLHNYGDFLVRNSLVNPGELILSFMLRSMTPTHVAVNSFEFQKFRHFKFEDESFLTITSLIDHHLNNKKPILLHIPDSLIMTPIVNPINNSKGKDSNNNIDNSYDESLVEPHDMGKGKWTGSQPLLSLDGPSISELGKGTSGLERCPSMPYVKKSRFSIKSANNNNDNNTIDNNNDISRHISAGDVLIKDFNKNMQIGSTIATVVAISDIATNNTISDTANKNNDYQDFNKSKKSFDGDVNYLKLEKNINKSSSLINLPETNSSPPPSSSLAPPPPSSSSTSLMKLKIPQQSPKSTMTKTPTFSSSSSSGVSSSFSLSPLSPPPPSSSSSSEAAVASSSTAAAIVTVAAPPKPSRMPTIKLQDSLATNRPVIKIRNITLYEGKDDDDDDDDDDVTGDSGKRKIGNSMNESSTSLSSSITSPSSPSSYFRNMSTYKSELISEDSVKPLNPILTLKIRELFLQTNPNVISKHITHVDIEIARLNQFNDDNLGSLSGLELMTLPQGRELRQDVIERHYTMKLFIGAMILISPSPEERCNILSHWLNVAFELKVNAGNVLGFYSIMEALCSSQIVRQKNVWKLLKKLHPSTFEIFEAKLLPNYKSLLDGSAILMPYQRDTILPHVLPLMEIMEKFVYTSDEIAGSGGYDKMKLNTWEMNQTHFGLNVVLIHLDTARLITQRVNLYLGAISKFEKSNLVQFSILKDLLDPRTHGVYLWGSRGVLVDRGERVSKFESLLTILSEKYEQ